MKRMRSTTTLIMLLVLLNVPLLQAQTQPAIEKQRGAFPFPGPVEPPDTSAEEEPRFLLPPPVSERELPELSIKELKREPSDGDLIATLDGVNLMRGEVRVAAFLLRRSAPELTQEEAFRHALFEAVVRLIYYAEAIKQKMVLPLAEAAKVADEQHTLCQSSQECRETTAAVASALGLSADQYWSAERYQRALTAEIMTGKAISDISSTDPEQMRKVGQELQKQVVTTAPIQWLDSNLAREFPNVVANMKPVGLRKHTEEVHDIEVQ